MSRANPDGTINLTAVLAKGRRRDAAAKSCAALAALLAPLHQRADRADLLCCGKRGGAGEWAHVAYEDVAAAIAGVEGMVLRTTPRSLADVAAVLAVAIARVDEVTQEEGLHASLGSVGDAMVAALGALVQAAGVSHAALPLALYAPGVIAEMAHAA